MTESAQGRERKPTDTVITNLRIKESLRLALEREADKNGVSLNREMSRRLEKSIEGEDNLALNVVGDRLHAICNDMEMKWLRYRERFLERELEVSREQQHITRSKEINGPGRWD
jgi:hypothetical protein